MKIHRSPVTANFTQIPNAALRDTRLSWKARGLLAYLLSHVDEGWTVDADRLTKKGPDGRHAILAGLKELVDAGYVVRRKRRAERGQWVTDIEVFDQPGNGTNGTPPASENPTSGNQTSEDQPQEEKDQVTPEAGFPTSGNPTAGQPTPGQPDADLEHGEEHHQEDHQEDHEDLGGTLPPNPLRPDDPPGHRTESENSLSERGDQPPQADTATHDRTRAETLPRPAGCPDHGRAFAAGFREDGKPACPLCRRGAPATPVPGHLADVIPLNRRSVS